MAQIASVSARSGGSVGRVPMGCVHNTLAPLSSSALTNARVSAAAASFGRNTNTG